MRQVVSSLFLVLFLLVSADRAEAGRPRYADPGALGPYGVGHSIFETNDPARNDRYLRVEVWYPVDPENADGDPTFYDFQFFGLGLTSPVAFEDAPPSREIGFPLVIFSHGSGGVSFQSTPLMETLASHGMVVVAPNHTGNTANDVLAGTTDPFYTIAENRPRDVSFLIDLMLARNLDSEDPLYLKMDPGAVGVVGHSFGGFTALAAASGYHVPSLGIDVPADKRVRAIVPIAPASGILSDADLESIHVPTLILSGTLDDTTPIDDQTTRPWAIMTTRPFYRADIVGATHLSFANGCDIATALLDFGVKEKDVAFLVPGYYDTCGPAAFPIEEVRRLENFYVTAFLKKHLWEDSRYDSFLTPDYAASHEPGVYFARKDKGQ